MESPTAREQRLQHRRERERALWAAETAGERLRKRRKRDQERRAAETGWTGWVKIRGKDWQESLKMSVRLDWTGWVWIRGKDWQESLDSHDEWEGRLRMINRRRSERLAMKSHVERENRLQNDRERHGTLPLLEQPAVKSKMQKFHQHLATLETPICSTCCKQFPGLKINSQSGECLSCSRDKCIPKLY